MNVCPRIGCRGEVVDGTCGTCGAPVAEVLAQRGEQLRRMTSTKESGGSGWFHTGDLADDEPRPSPASSNQPAPGEPGPGQPAPGEPASGQPVPGQSTGQSAPDQPVSGQRVGQPGSNQPAPDRSVPGEPASGRPASGQPVPGQSTGHPAPSQPASGHPVLSQPAPGHSAPQQSAPSRSIPGRPVPVRPASSQPTSGQSAQNQPLPNQPVPSQPVPSQPAAGQPVWTPPPSVDAPTDRSAAVHNGPAAEPGPPPEADDSQPTSVLSTTPPTLSIDPPRPVEAPGTQAQPTPPGTQPAPARATGSDSAPGTGGFPSSGRRTQSRASSRSRLGAGLVDVPLVPIKDPASAVLDDPAVAESKRYCNNCGAEVGRAKNGEPAVTEGECAACGTPFNFRPRLRRGDLVGGQYEVLGCLAYGGLGWIYLAKDHNVSDRWVVLKGMIDTGDATSMASAVAERRFLAEVEHPNVVKIYNFVQHPDPKTGTSVGYIVMEYIGGQSLRQLALEQHRALGRAEPLPIGQVLAYGLEILPAIGYLHSVDLLYCDLKPDNVIQAGEQLKLIDLGAVRKVDDYESPLFFTLGYSAPELATEGASVASDIYTVGRTLAVLSIEFAGYTGRHQYTLPGPAEEPLFALFGSYHRVLKRATHPDPARRFRSAEEMADQLTGVLREVMSLGTGRPRSGPSAGFAAETRTFGAGLVVGAPGGPLPVPDPYEVAGVLPLPLVDTDDHAAGVLASISATEPGELATALAAAPQDSVEVRLRQVKVRIEQGDLRGAHAELSAARAMVVDPADWRPDWYLGLIALVARSFADATTAFDRVYDAVPGEIAPKLALAVAAELAGNHFAAARFYELVWRTDRGFVSAAFGLARVYLAQGARTGAIEVLESIPDTSSHHLAAQVASIKVKTRHGDVARLGEHDLHDAARRLERLALDAERRARLSAEVLEAAYGWVRANRGQVPAGTGRTVLGCGLSERDLQFGLERCYRALARLAGSPQQRHELVDKANAIRPRTMT